MADWQSTSSSKEGNCWSMCCKKECRCASFGLNHSKPPLFAESLWQSRPNIAYVVYRIIVAVYFVPWLALSGVGNRREGPTWFLYLTNWSFLILTIRLLVQAYIALAHFIHHNVQDKVFRQKLNWIMKTEWVLYNISCSSALLASILFWFFLYLPQIDTYFLDITNIHTHGINSAMVLLDIWVAAIPLRFLHIFQSLGFVLIYYVFNAIYVLAGGRDVDGNAYIYASFDWLNDPVQATIGVASALAMILAIWIVLWLMSWLVTAISSCCCPCCNVRDSSRQCRAVECSNGQQGCVGCDGQRVVQGWVNHGGVFTLSQQEPHLSTIYVS